MTTVTVLSGPECRRRWTMAEKLRIVKESLAEGVNVTEVARRHDIHPHLLHAWRASACYRECRGAKVVLLRLLSRLPVMPCTCGRMKRASGRCRGVVAQRPRSACVRARDAGACGSACRCPGGRRTTPIPVGTQIWVACGATDMRKGFDGLARDFVPWRFPDAGVWSAW
jgi:hypothetical protein